MNVTNYKPPPTVERFMLDDAPFRLIMGPVGSGKSTGCMIEIARRAGMQAPSRDGLRHTRWAIIRNTKQQLRDTTLKTWNEWFPPGVAGTWKETTMTFTMRFADVHAEVLFRALDDPEDVRQLLSLELTGAYGNEMRELDMSIVVALRSRCGRYPSRKEVAPTWYGVIGDTNPPDEDHWIYQKFELEKPRGWVIFKQPGGLDPDAENRENLPENYYEDMMEGATANWIKVHVHAKYGPSKVGKPVYENSFIEDFHVSKVELRPITSLPLIIGMDFGRTPAATFEQRDLQGRQLILDEVWADNSGLEGFLQKYVTPLINRRFLGMKIIVCGDPAGWDKSQINDLSCADILRQQKYKAIKATTNATDRRIEAVERQLAGQIDGKAKLLIDPRCKRLITGFKRGYMYRATRTGFEVSPHKNEFSHIHDARQYAALCSEFAGAHAQGLGSDQVREVEVVSAVGWT